MKLDKLIAQIKYADAAVKDKNLSPSPEAAEAWQTIADNLRTVLNINYGDIINAAVKKDAPKIAAVKK